MRFLEFMEMRRQFESHVPETVLPNVVTGFYKAQEEGPVSDLPEKSISQYMKLIQ